METIEPKERETQRCGDVKFEGTREQWWELVSQNLRKELTISEHTISKLEAENKELKEERNRHTLMISNMREVICKSVDSAIDQLLTKNEA